MKTHELDLLNDKVPSLFHHFAIPGVLSSLSMCLYGVIDGVILGRFIGENAMAAVNMASPIFNIISCLAILIAIGGNTLVGISLGQQNRDKANHYFNNAVMALFTIAADTQADKKDNEEETDEEAKMTPLEVIETETAIFVVRAEDITDYENSTESAEGKADSIKDVIKSEWLEEKAVEDLKGKVNDEGDKYKVTGKKEDEIKKLNDKLFSTI